MSKKKIAKSKKKKTQGKKECYYGNKFLPAGTIPIVPNPKVPELQDNYEFPILPLNNFKQKEPVKKVDPEKKLALEKMLFSHYIENIPETCTKKIVYVMQGDGIFERRINKLGTFITKLSDVKIPGLRTDLKVGYKLNIPKIPASYLGTIVSFFRSICNKYQSEVFLQLFYDFKEKQYILHCPKQVIGGASVNYTNDEVFEDKNKVLVFEVHSHVNMNAFFSGTDDYDEKADRFYGVVGKISQFFPEIKLRLMIGGKAQEISVEDLFTVDEEMYHLENFPKDWINNIKETEKTYQQYEYGQQYGSYNQYGQQYGPHNQYGQQVLPYNASKYNNQDFLYPDYDLEDEEYSGYWVKEGTKDWWIENGEKQYYKENGTFYQAEEELEDCESDLKEISNRFEFTDHTKIKF